MKKALILAYDFPPYNSIGAQRPYAWYKYFHEFGLYPFVITRQWRDDVSPSVAYCSSGYSENVDVHTSDDGEIHYVPYHSNFRDKQILNPGNGLKRLLAKTMSGLQVMTELFCFAFDNKKAIYRYADEWLKNNTVDYILVSGEPFVLFRYASLLSKKHNIPWVGDYRDGWSWNYSLKHSILRFWLQLFEKRISNKAQHLTTVSESFRASLHNLFPEKHIHVVYNGYFQELFDNIKPVKKSGFEIVFSGTLYPYQPIELFFDALSGIDPIHIPKDLRIVFYGMKTQPEQIARIKKATEDLKNINIVFTERLPQTNLIAELASAEILLLPANPDYPQLYAKVFEYMALNKHILYFIPDASDLEYVLKDAPNVFACKSTTEIYSVLLKLLTSEIMIQPNYDTFFFHRKKQVERLANILS